MSLPSWQTIEAGETFYFRPFLYQSRRAILCLNARCDTPWMVQLSKPQVVGPITFLIFQSGRSSKSPLGEAVRNVQRRDR